MTRSILAGLGGLHALAATLDRDRFELLVQRELLDQRGTQLGIVIDDQDLATVCHARASGWGEVDHAAAKEQADCEG